MYISIYPKKHIKYTVYNIDPMVRLLCDDSLIPNIKYSFGTLAQSLKASIWIGDVFPGECVAIFSHGGVLSQLYCHATGYFYKGHSYNCSINRILVDGKTWAVTTWGDVDHLKSVGFDSAAFGGNQNSGWALLNNNHELRSFIVRQPKNLHLS